MVVEVVDAVVNVAHELFYFTKFKRSASDNVLFGWITCEMQHFAALVYGTKLCALTPTISVHILKNASAKCPYKRRI